MFLKFKISNNAFPYWTIHIFNMLNQAQSHTDMINAKLAMPQR